MPDDKNFCTLMVVITGADMDLPLIVGLVRVLLVKVCVAARVTTVSEAEGKANDVLSVPVNVKVLLAVSVFPLAIVNVPVDEVMVNPLMLVAVAAPSAGAVKVLFVNV